MSYYSIFFSGLIFTTAQVVFIIAKISFIFTPLSAVQIYDFHISKVVYQYFSQYHGPKPELYGRYIDDCIGATSSTREELTHFITAVNSFHPALLYLGNFRHFFGFSRYQNFN